MARPHICFVQAQMLPWVRGIPGGRTDVESKTLSADDHDGSATAIVRYPSGWCADRPEHLSAHEEFLVLDGAIEINDRRYEKHAYAFLPAGYPRESARASHGAVLLSMFYGSPQVVRGAPRHAFDEKRLIDYVNPLAMEWDPRLVDPQLASGVAIKPLRTDPVTHEVSFLYCSPPHRVPADMAKPQWTHPMIEELYVIDGEYVWADLGRMRAGGYAWWRENRYHGPAGTDTGYHLFVRTIGGPLVNEFATDKLPFTWNPEHRPALPPALAPFGQALPRQPNF